MMTVRFRRTLSLALATLTIGATEIAADPITAVYDVQVYERFSRQGVDPGVLEPFLQLFSLSITIDPDSPPGAGVYGAPTFSAIPLPLPPPPDGLVLSSGGSTTHIPTSSGAFAQASVRTFGSTTIDGNLVVYSAALQLGGPMPTGSQPALATPETFFQHLDLARFGSFGPYNFTSSACLGVGPFPPGADACDDARAPGTRIVTYRGTATLTEINPAPIPEPATLALVGSGLALLVRRTRRARRASRETS